MEYIVLAIVYSAITWLEEFALILVVMIQERYHDVGTTT
jgi:hypothetical protein